MADKVVVLFLALALWTSVSLAACPALVPQCYCQKKFTWYSYVYCDDLTADEVPPFGESTTVYTEVRQRQPR